MYAYKTAENQVAKSSYRLATGQRINSGADDAAGFKVRENLRAELKSLEASSANISKGENTLNVAQSAINQTLTVLRGDPDDNSNNGLVGLLSSLQTDSSGTITPSADEISAYEDMVSQLQSALGSASYNGVALFDAGTSFDITIGKDTSGTAQTIKVDTTKNAGIADADMTAIDVTLASGNAAAALTSVNNAIKSLTTESGRLGYKQNAVSNVKNSLSAQSTMLKEADGRISSVDTALEGSNLARAELLAQNSMNVMQYSRSFASFVATSAFR